MTDGRRSLTDYQRSDILLELNRLLSNDNDGDKIMASDMRKSFDNAMGKDTKRELSIKLPLPKFLIKPIVALVTKLATKMAGKQLESGQSTSARSGFAGITITNENPTTPYTPSIDLGSVPDFLNDLQPKKEPPKPEKSPLTKGLLGAIAAAYIATLSYVGTLDRPTPTEPEAGKTPSTKTHNTQGINISPLLNTKSTNWVGKTGGTPAQKSAAQNQGIGGRS